MLMLNLSLFDLSFHNQYCNVHLNETSCPSHTVQQTVSFFQCYREMFHDRMTERTVGIPSLIPLTVAHKYYEVVDQVKFHSKYDHILLAFFSGGREKH